ncbi:MAG: 4-hydroxy-3-methylbut-2-enyl diphosphate reductase [Candidatus Woykebacteria bacterium]
MVNTLILAKPRGYCAGVARAVEAVEKVLEIYSPPVYVKHAIVHNVNVVKDLERKGAIFVEEVKEIPKNSVVVFSAHGSPPHQYEEAKNRNLKLIDAVCPLVTKVHVEAKTYAQKGYTIIQVGHRGHLEPIGVEGEVRGVNGEYYLVDNKIDAEKIDVKRDEIAILTQTTLSLDDTSEIIDILRKKFPRALFPPSKDICYATENRQAAVKLLAKKAELVLVIGSETSSNSNRLREVAESYGSRAYLIDDVTYINDKWLEGAKVVGLTSGASVPEYLIDEAISYFKKLGVEKIQEVEAVEENVYFPLPAEVRGRISI